MVKSENSVMRMSLANSITKWALGFLVCVVLHGEELAVVDSIDTAVENEVTEYEMVVDEEEYRIYSAILLHILDSEQIPFTREHIIIRNLTATDLMVPEQRIYEYWEVVSEAVNIEVDTVTVQDYIVKNRTKFLLTDMFDIHQNIVLISDEELRELCESGKLYERYPKSTMVYELSRVGFNVEHTCAIVYFTENVHVPLGGSGYVALLVKKDGTWVVMECRGLWRS